MPTYMYKAATSTGLIVRNRVEASSKQNLLRTLKENELMPITIEQVAYSAKKKKTKKKNVKDIEEIMKNVNTTKINTKKTSTVKEKIKELWCDIQHAFEQRLLPMNFKNGLLGIGWGLIFLKELGLIEDNLEEFLSVFH